MNGGVVGGSAAVVAASLMLGILAGFGVVYGHLVAMFVVWIFLAYLIGRRCATGRDLWLPRLMAVAMVVKLAGSWVRLYVLEVVYDFSGDAGLYHGFGREIARTWRTLNVPDLATVGFGSEGTRFVAWLTGLFYAPYEPSILGGFWIFSLLAFMGQLFFYLAFRVWSDRPGLKRYALLIFLWPTFVYWPSSIGKEATIMFFLGIGTWAAAHLYRYFQVRWLPLVGAAAVIIFIIRPHVAALFVGTLLLGALLGKRRTGAEVATRRVMVLLVGLASLPVLALGVGEKFDVEGGGPLTVEALDAVLSDVEETTEQGGSAVSGGVIRSPVDIPAGALKVLFRPLPHEAGNAQMLAASLEGALLSGLILWRLPTMIGNLRHLRRSPYSMFCAIYTALFIFAWSAILNLGIMARQRTLVLPFLLALVVQLGWHSEPSEDESAEGRRLDGSREEDHLPEEVRSSGGLKTSF